RRESRPERELSGVCVEFDVLEHPRRRVARGNRRPPAPESRTRAVWLQSGPPARRTVMPPLLPSLLLLAAAGPAVAADAIGRDALGSRTVRLAYEARVTPPPGTERVELWLPLPREENQAVRELKLSGSARVTVLRLPESADRVAW